MTEVIATAATFNICFVTAVDATSASLKNGEMRSVFHTAELSNLQFPAEVDLPAA